MKKLILIQLILLQTVFSFGQGSLQLFTASGDQIMNGQTIEVAVTDLDAFETVSEEYFVRNNSSVDMEVMLRQEAVVLIDGAEFSFCALGNCFPPNVNETSRAFTITAQTTVDEGGVMTGHYHAHGYAGISTIRYIYFNESNLNDTLSFFITFNGEMITTSSLQLFNAEGEEIVNGQNINVTIDDLNFWEYVSPELFVKNNSASDIDIKCRRDVLNEVEGTMNYFCALGLCLSPYTDELPNPYTLPAGQLVDEAGVFTGHYSPNGNVGVEIVKYKFFNVNNPNDTIAFYVSFNDGSTASIGHVENVNMKVYPNPATDVLNVSYQLNSINDAQFIMYNATGIEVLNRNIHNSVGNLILNVSDLPKGVYLYRFEGSNGFSQTSKVVLK